MMRDPGAEQQRWGVAPAGERQQGFTLIEVVTVVVIIGLMGLIATTSFLRWLPNMQLKGAARDLYSTLHQAKMEAIKENQDWAVNFDPAGNTYSLIADSGGTNRVVSTVDLSGLRNGIQFGSGVATLSPTTPPGALPGDHVSYTGNQVVFNSRGTGNGGYVYLENEQQNTTYAIGTLTSGAIRLVKWNGADWQ